MKAEIAREVLNYINGQNVYGEKVTGRLLENQFTGLGFGWDAEILRVVLAALLRGGGIEVTYQGRRYRDYRDPLVRPPFTGTQAFRSASFAPREIIDIRSLVKAAENLERLTGDEVDVEEETIASRFKAFAQAELGSLGPVDAKITANRLPSSNRLTEYHDTLRTINDAPSDDCVRILAGEGQTLLEERSHARTIREALSDHYLDKIQESRFALSTLWPEMDQLSPYPGDSSAPDQLKVLLGSEELYSRPDELVELTNRITDDYILVYELTHQWRHDVYQDAIDQITQRPEWQRLILPADASEEEKLNAQDLRETILIELQSKACHETALDERRYRCASCHSSIGQLQSDRLGVASMRQDALQQLWEAIEPQTEDVAPQYVRVTDFVTGPISDEDELKRFIERLEQEIVSLLRAGGRVILE